MSLLEVYAEKNKQGCYHLGHIVLDFLKSKPGDEIFQVDAATGEQESYASVIRWSVGVARALRARGSRPGDVLALGGRNHLRLAATYFAGLYCGLPVAGVDPTFKFDEIKAMFAIIRPRFAFCEAAARAHYDRAVRELELDAHVISFDELDSFVAEGGDSDDEEFQPSEFDLQKIYAWLVSTSGTSGTPKVAAITHPSVIQKLMRYLQLGLPGGGQYALHLSPVQWVSSYFNSFTYPMIGFAKLQTSADATVDHVIDIINEFKPSTMFSSPSMPALIVRSDRPCDLTSLNYIIITGSKLYMETVQEMKARMRPDAVIINGYGQTELLGPVLMPNPGGPIESCGVPIPGSDIKLVNLETEEEITEPNVTGELWYKGIQFTEYYNNPEETAKALTPDGWFRTGDLLYRDADNNYFFVDRYKMLIKYRNIHVVPPEVEEVIMSHPRVLEAAVAGAPHRADGERVAACVVVRPGHGTVTAEEIQDLVASMLSDGKRLRGGVVFLDELPKTSTGKVARNKIKEIIIKAQAEVQG